MCTATVILRNKLIWWTKRSMLNWHSIRWHRHPVNRTNNRTILSIWLGMRFTTVWFAREKMNDFGQFYATLLRCKIERKRIRLTLNGLGHGCRLFLNYNNTFSNMMWRWENSNNFESHKRTYRWFWNWWCNKLLSEYYSNESSYKNRLKRITF